MPPCTGHELDIIQVKHKDHSHCHFSITHTFIIHCQVWDPFLIMKSCKVVQVLSPPSTKKKIGDFFIHIVIIEYLASRPFTHLISRFSRCSYNVIWSAAKRFETIGYATVHHKKELCTCFVAFIGALFVFLS